MAVRRLLPIALLLLGCPSAVEEPPDPPDPTPAPAVFPGVEGGRVELGEPVSCASPVDGFARLSFELRLAG